MEGASRLERTAGCGALGALCSFLEGGDGNAAAHGRMAHLRMHAWALAGRSCIGRLGDGRQGYQAVLACSSGYTESGRVPLHMMLLEVQSHCVKGLNPMEQGGFPEPPCYLKGGTVEQPVA